MIYDFFDAAYYINLDSRPDRREAFERRSEEAGIEAERFAAICPPPVPLSKTTDEREHFKIGCKMSHDGCVQLAKERNQKRILIFEDDCVFVPDFADKFPRYVDELKMVEDWDMCFLGGSPEPAFLKKGDVCTQETSNLFLNPGAVWGAHAYAMNSQFYDKVLNFGAFPADIAFIYIPNRRYLMTGDLLAYQDESFSDLWGQSFNRFEEYQKHYQKYIR